MIITKKHLSRRTLLRGMGTAIALPMLDAMIPALRGATKAVNRVAPDRMVFVYVPNGIDMRNWRPKESAATSPSRRFCSRSLLCRMTCWSSAVCRIRTATPWATVQEIMRAQRPVFSPAFILERRPVPIFPLASLSIRLLRKKWAALRAWRRSSSVAKTAIWPAIVIRVIAAPM